MLEKHDTRILTKIQLSQESIFGLVGFDDWGVTSTVLGSLCWLVFRALHLWSSHGEHTPECTLIFNSCQPFWV